MVPELMHLVHSREWVRQMIKLQGHNFLGGIACVLFVWFHTVVWCVRVNEVNGGSVV